MTESSSESADDSLAGNELEDEVYVAWFENEGPARASAIEVLLADHPSRTAEIQEVVRRLGEGSRLFAHLAGEVEELTHEAKRRIGVYEITEPLGEGGFGTVYRAQQHDPVQREVALKILKSGLQSQRAMARFASERQALARLRHSNIAQVYDAGTTSEGQPFIAMELLDGEPITVHCDLKRLDIRSRLLLFLEACAGVLHAHQRGIIHRDLKPTNVLVDVSGDIARPRIIDFGLAKALDESLGGDVALTIDGAFVGTPGYSSPEQAAGEATDTRTDVHALGVLLFELLTGDLPHGRAQLEQRSLQDVLRLMRETDARLPSSVFGRGSDLPSTQIATNATNRGSTSAKLRRRLRGDLDRIVSHCVARGPDERYPSVAALSDDIRRHLDDLPISARRPTLGYVARKLARHHRVALSIALSLIAGLIVGVTAIVWGVIEVTAARDDAIDARDDAVEAKEVARFNSYAAELSAANLAIDAGDIAEADRHLTATPPEFRGWEYQLLRNRTDEAEIVMLFESAVTRAIWIRDGTNSKISLVRTTGEIELWDVDRGEQLASATIPDARYVGRVVPFPDSHRALVLVNESPSRVVMVDLLEAEVLNTMMDVNHVEGIAISPDGKLFVCSDRAGIRSRSIEGDGEISMVLPRERRARTAATTLAFWADGKSLILGGLDGSIRRIDLHGVTLAPDFRKSPHKARVTTLALDPSRGLLVTGDLDDRVVTWDLESGRVRYVRGGLRTQSLQIGSSSGTLFVGGGYLQSTLSSFHLETGSLIRTYIGHRSGSVRVALSPDGKRLASVSADRTLRVFRRQPHPNRYYLGWDSRTMAVDASGSCVVSLSQDGRLYARNLQDYSVKEIELAEQRYGGERLATANGLAYVFGWDGILRVFDLESGVVVREKRVARRRVRCFGLAVSPDGSALFCSTTASVVSLIDTSTLEARWSKPLSHITQMEFSPDGRQLLVAGRAGRVELLNAETGESTRHRDLDSEVSEVRFDGDGATIAVAGAERLYILDANLRTTAERPAAVGPISIAFSPDGSRIITGGLDLVLRVYDRESLREILTLRTPGVDQLTFSTDGQRLFARSGGWDAPHHIHVWDASMPSGR